MSEDQRECEILETLAKHGALHVTEIAQKIDSHPISVDRICTRLYNDDQISLFSHGHYRLTDNGRQRLTDIHDWST